MVPTFTSHAFSPVVDRGLVIFHLGGHDGGALTAFDVNTGAEKWSWKGDGPGYGSPVVADIGGTRQIITITQKMLVGLDAATGARAVAASVGQPERYQLHHAGRVRPERSSSRATAIRRPRSRSARSDGKWVVETVWQNADIPMRMSNPGARGRHAVRACRPRNSGQYFAVDAKTRQDAVALRGPAGRQRGAWPRQDPLLLSLENDGELVVARASQTAFELVKRYKLADTETWTQRRISGNRISSRT